MMMLLLLMMMLIRSRSENKRRRPLPEAGSDQPTSEGERTQNASLTHAPCCRHASLCVPNSCLGPIVAPPPSPPPLRGNVDENGDDDRSDDLLSRGLPAASASLPSASSESPVVPVPPALRPTTAPATGTKSVFLPPPAVAGVTTTRSSPRRSCDRT